MEVLLRLGKTPSYSFKRWLRHYNYRQNLQMRRTALLVLPNTSYPSKRFELYIPNHWSVFLLNLKKSNTGVKILYLKSANYFFKIPYVCRVMSFEFDVYTHSISILLTNRTPYISLYLKSVQQALYMFSQVQFMRMRFKGKGYYIYKTLRNTIAPNFGYAHRVYVYAYFVSLKFLSKTSVILFGASKRDLFKVGYAFKATRPINIFTGRGVRFVRQIVYKKVGKVSSYR